MRRLLQIRAAMLLALSLWPCQVEAAEIQHIALKGGGDAITITGEIKLGDDEKFRKLSLSYQSATVALESPGGLLSPALEIGKMIRLRGYSTFVFDGSTCASTCALIWLAGSPRIAERGAKIGFHAAYLMTDAVPMETGVGNALVGSYLNLLNLPERAVIFATSAPPTSVKWLDLDQLGPSGIEARVVDRDGPRRTADSPPRTTIATPPPIRQAAPSAAPTFSKGQLRLALINAFHDPKVVAQAARTIGLGGQEEILLTEYMKALYANEHYLELLTDRIYSRRAELNNVSAKSVGRDVAEQLSTELQLSGLSALDDQSIKDYFYYLDAIPRYASAQECKAMFSESGSADGALEMKLVARIGPSAFASYLKLLQKAVTASLANQNGYRVTDEEGDAADRMYARALEDEYSRLPKDELARVSAALDSRENADATDLCRSYQIIFSAAYRLPGKEGNWYRRKAIADFGKPPSR